MTAELAAGLPVLVLVVAAAVSAVGVAGAQVRVHDAAREAARAAARDDPAMARLLAQRVAPGAGVVIATAGDVVVATTRLTVHPLAGWLPAFVITGTATAAREQSRP